MSTGTWIDGRSLGMNMGAFLGLHYGTYSVARPRTPRTEPSRRKQACAQSMRAFWARICIQNTSDGERSNQRWNKVAGYLYAPPRASADDARWSSTYVFTWVHLEKHRGQKDALDDERKILEPGRSETGMGIGIGIGTGGRVMATMISM